MSVKYHSLFYYVVYDIIEESSGFLALSVNLDFLLFSKLPLGRHGHFPFKALAKRSRK